MYVIEDYDVRTVDLNIGDYDKDWFDFDMFPREKFSTCFKYHAENFSNTEKPVDFEATRYPNETFMLEDKEHSNWFNVEIDHNTCKDYYFAKTQELEDYLIKLWHEDEDNIKGLYMCEFVIKNYPTLLKIFNKISELSESVKIEVYFNVAFNYIEDFVKTACNLKKIPQELKKYFETSFVNDMNSIKIKNHRDDVIYRSGISIKNNGKEFIFFGKSSIRDSFGFYYEGIDCMKNALD